MKIPTWLRDWWRGYSDADIAIVRKKSRLGQWVGDTNGERMAIKSGALLWQDPRTRDEAEVLADWIKHGGKIL